MEIMLQLLTVSETSNMWYNTFLRCWAVGATAPANPLSRAITQHSAVARIVWMCVANKLHGMSIFCYNMDFVLDGSFKIGGLCKCSKHI